jgi:branched-chain amino acid transport system ATP-binding protein
MPPEPLLAIRGLSHHFGGLQAITDFELDLLPGELLGLIGPNGAGKTTVFNLITGVYRATRGSIRLAGSELVGRRSCHIVAQGVARTFQSIRLFRELSVLDNVRAAFYARGGYSTLEALAHGGRFHRTERHTLKEAMELMGLLGLDAYASMRSADLPYGLQRRLEIARALATKPRLLLLDEPAAGMNPSEIADLMRFIGWIRSQFNLTLILIEHQMRLVMNLCERLTVLEFGVTIAQGTPEHIRQHPKVLEAYLGTQKN